MTSRLRIAGVVLDIEGDAGQVSETLGELAEFLARGQKAQAAVDAAIEAPRCQVCGQYDCGTVMVNDTDEARAEHEPPKPRTRKAKR